MIDLSALKLIIYTYINSATNVVCIWANQNGEVPANPFIRMLISDFQQIGQAQTVKAEIQTGAGETEICSTIECNLELQCFGQNSIETLLNLRSFISTPEGTSYLTENNIAIAEWSNSIIDISSIENDHNEERASYELRLRFTDITSDAPSGSIEVVEGEMSLENLDDTIITRDILVDSTII